MGAGILSGGVGMKYYLTDVTKRKLNYFIGPNIMVEYEIPAAMYYLPLGITYFTKSNLHLGFEAGVMYSKAIEPEPSPWIGIELGYRLGKTFNPEFTDGFAETNQLSEKNFISFSLGASSLLFGVVYERLISNYVGIEVGVGLVSAGLGAKIYPFQLKKETPSFHFGVSHSYFIFLWAGDTWNTYLPVGFDYITPYNFRYSIDAGPLLSWDNNSADLYPALNFRIGKAF